tara:strand:- start:43 stop:312 length:270 start_codon:yes stop_codon:yes gene_type:complete
MDIDTFLRKAGAPSPADFAGRLGVSSDQLRQWRFGYSNRRPGPEMCVVIERESELAIRRWDLRPDDWYRIWPELIGAEGAPEPQAEQGV